MSTLLDDFCSAHAVKLTCVLLGYESEAHKPKGEQWAHFAWRVTLTVGDDPRSHTTDYRTGIGHVHPLPAAFAREDHESVRKQKWLTHAKAPVAPSPADVLSSLLSDAQSASDSFESFCSDLGYDTDSRRALGTYLACQKSGTAVRVLLGSLYTAACEAAQEH